MIYLLSFLIATACLLVVYGWATATFAPSARGRKVLASFLVVLLALENATGMAARYLKTSTGPRGSTPSARSS